MIDSPSFFFYKLTLRMRYYLIDMNDEQKIKLFYVRHLDIMEYNQNLKMNVYIGGSGMDLKV